MTSRSLRRAVAVTAAALCGAGTAYLAVPDSWSSGGSAVTEAVAGSVPGRSPSAGSIPASSASVAPGALPSEALPAGQEPPVRVLVERLGIDVPVEPHGVDSQGRMALPEDPGVAGWYRYGPAPASAAGAVVVAAHVDSRERGIGPFARLASARGGDRVLVEAGGRQWRYDVTAVVRIGKDTGDLARFFARDGFPRLHLVTCTGRYEQGSGYEANLVVVAERTERAS